MTKPKPSLPWEAIETHECPDKKPGCCVYHRNYWRWVPEKHAQAFHELVRRVVRKEDFSSLARKLWETIFNEKL